MLTPSAKVTDTWHFSEKPNILSNTFGEEEFDFNDTEENNFYEENYELDFDDVELI